MGEDKSLEMHKEEQTFLDDLCILVSGARTKAFVSINYSLVERNWNIGRLIVEQEQQGNVRAEYGKRVMELASRRLTREFGKGFSITNIKNFRSFYLKFRNLLINETPSDFSATAKGQALPDLLPWTHYERLIRVQNPEAREWYAREALLQTWSYRTLDRNINTQYYDRLLLSQRKSPVTKEMKERTHQYQTNLLLSRTP